MNKRLLNAFMFAVGAAIGSAVTWKLVKTKYEQLANEEIESVKAVFNRRAKESKEKLEELSEMKTMVTDLGYQTQKEENEEMDTGGSGVYVIPPDEFGDDESYETQSLTLFEDGVLVDDDGFIVEDVEGTVGEESLDHFGEWEDDSVFVKNDRYHTYYEILKDLRNYSDIVEGK